jgi:CO/xanthine dehydrogenase FAD-binding subunit
MQPTLERAISLEHALELRRQGFVPLAGATDIYPNMLPRLGKSPPTQQPYVDMSSVPGLNTIRLTEECVELGCMATWTDIAKTRLPRSCFALQQAAIEIGGVQIQNQATLGGNICNASPAADGVAALLALDAMVVLRSKEKTRKLLISEFVLGNRTTALRSDELLTSVEIPLSMDRTSSSFSKIGGRKYLIIAIASAAARLQCAAGVITRASVAVGACSAVPSRLDALETWLVGRPVTPAVPLVFDADGFLSQLKPIDDVRATKSFRLDAAGVLVRRALRACLMDLASRPTDRE